MNQLPRWAWAVLVAVVICVLGTFPQLLAAIIGIAIVGGAVLLVVVGFIQFVIHMDIMPPWPVVIVLGLVCLLWPPALGIVVGVGIVGALFVLVATALNHWDR